MFFFFQAEDGIRDLVRSRGLGDVYKRQVTKVSLPAEKFVIYAIEDDLALRSEPSVTGYLWTVSYTHLTLPTSDLV